MESRTRLAQGPAHASQLNHMLHKWGGICKVRQSTYKAIKPKMYLIIKSSQTNMTFLHKNILGLKVIKESGEAFFCLFLFSTGKQTTILVAKKSGGPKE